MPEQPDISEPQFEALIKNFHDIAAYEEDVVSATPERLAQLHEEIVARFPEVTKPELPVYPSAFIRIFEKHFGILDPSPPIGDTALHLAWTLQQARCWVLYETVKELGPDSVAAQRVVRQLRARLGGSGSEGPPDVKAYVNLSRPIVTIIGAGVTGLTAAHELAERGFRVQVIEKEGAHMRAPNATETDKPAPFPTSIVVGGMAATQPCEIVLHKHLLGSTDWKWRQATPIGTNPANLIEVTYPVGGKDPLTNVEDRIKKLLSPGRLLHAVAENLPEGARNARLKIHFLRGDEVRREALLSKLKTVVNIEVESVAGVPPKLEVKFGAPEFAEDPSRFQPEIATFSAGLSTATELGAIVEVTFADSCVLPGEHGYRFFPSFYRHLFDTMQRTPLYGKDDTETGRTAYDNLVPTHTQVFAGSQRTVAFTRAQARTLESFRRELKHMLETLHFDRRDIVRFSLRMLRFITSCKSRRAIYDALSWWDFVTLCDLAAPVEEKSLRLPYSDEFAFHVKAAPQALVAMDATTCDARTQGMVLIQLMLDQFLDRGPRTDSTLNGPTTEVWLDPWRRHLELLGVCFYHGELEGFYLDGKGEPEPKFKESPAALLPDLDAAYKPGADYVVLATDLATAAAVTRNPIFFNDPKPEPLCIPKGALIYATYDPNVRRLKTFSGVQFYFTQELSIARGHVYLPETEWGVSLISQLQFWQYRNRYRRVGVRGILSVDIGDFDRTSKYLDKSAARCASPAELAAEVWRQVSAPLRKGLTLGGLHPPEPIAFHVDDDLTLPLPTRPNPTFLVNLADDWQRRPGPEPWDPLYPGETTPGAAGPHVWQSEHGGYQVYFDKLVFAGTYLRTFTRMTTMEAANESARHAVNAILDHAAATNRINRRKVDALAQQLSQPENHAEILAEIQDLLTRPSITGEYCRIWDPERHELDDLEPFKRVDELLLADDRPHMFDILGIEALFERVAADVDDLTALLISAGDTAKIDWSLSTTEIVQALGKNLGKVLLAVVEKLAADSDSALLKKLVKTLTAA